MKKIIALILGIVCLFSVSACSSDKAAEKETVPQKAKTLPAAEVDPNSRYGADLNVNVKTIDNYLDCENTVYRDVRLLFDPGEYESIGGEADLSVAIKGFKVVPFPYIAPLSIVPIKNLYDGDCLFDVEYTGLSEIKSVKPNYEESMLVLEDMFPKDKNIVITCGGGGYSAMIKALLIKLGWDESRLYNIGGMWDYEGKNGVEVIVYPEDANDDPTFATWRVDYTYFDFNKMHPLKNESN